VLQFGLVGLESRDVEHEAAILQHLAMGIGYGEGVNQHVDGAAILAAHPAAYWRFNETNGTTAFDYAGGHNGAYTGPVTNGVPGPRGAGFVGLEADNTSYSFEGNFSIVKTQPPIPVNGNTLTTIALVQSVSPQKDYACILVSTREVNDVAYFSVRSAGTLAYDFNDDPLSDQFDSGLTLPDGGWAFVAETVAADQAVLYLDDGGGAGLQAVTNVLAAAPLPLTGSVSLGGDPNLNLGQDRTWNGGLDEIAYFTRTLSSTEIAAIHDALVNEALRLTAGTVGTDLVLTYTNGILQSADDVTGPWADVLGATSPSYSTSMTGLRRFFRLKN